MSDVQGFIEGVCFLGFLLLLIVFFFFQAAKPENKRIQTEKAPTIIEISWIFLLIVLTVSSSGILFVPALVFCIFLRMYFVKLYQLFNSDWRTDGTSVGIQSVENLGEALDNLPTPEEITNNVVDFTINEYRDKNSPLNKIVSLILWMFSPIIQFHKKNHQKRWFIFYVYFMAIFVGIPLLIFSLFIGDIIKFLIDFLYNEILHTISSFLNTF